MCYLVADPEKFCVEQLRYAIKRWMFFASVGILLHGAGNAREILQLYRRVCTNDYAGDPPPPGLFRSSASS